MTTNKISDDVLNKIIKAQRKDKVITVRMNERQRDLLNKRVSELGVTVSEYVCAFLELDNAFGLIEKCYKHDYVTVEELFGKTPQTMKELNE